jgi:long-chain acyl-CoA synthetase
VHPWLKHYDKHVPHSLSYPELSIAELFDQSVDRHGSRTCVSFMGTNLRYHEIQKDASRLAHVLYNSGVRQSDRVFLLLPNIPQFVIAYYAVMKLGAVAVPASPLDTASEIRHKIKDSGAKAAVYLDLLYRNIADSLSLLDFSISCDLRDYLPWTKRILFSIKLKFMRLPHPGSRSLNFRRTLAEAPAESIETLRIPPEDLAVIIYTGGTTGVSKGVMLSHHALGVNLTQAAAWGQVSATDINLCILPFFHGFGMSVGLNTTFTSGGRMILMPRWDVRAAIRTIQNDGVTLFAGVPTMYHAMIQHPDFSKIKGSKLRGCFVGAAPVPESLKKTFHERTGGILIEGYGLTEAVTAKSANPYLGLKKEKSIGIPWPDTVFRVVDDEGRAVSVGEQGEIIIKSPDLMMGYWKNPEATSQVIRDGWLYTGDIGTMDKDGYFYVVDRKKDLIISGGFNVYPTEIEEVLYRHPDIMEASVIGLPDESKGEVPVAFVVKRPDSSVDAAALQKFLSEHLIRYKVPHRYEFRTTLPKSPIGKILKKELRKEFANSGS